MPEEKPDIPVAESTAEMGLTGPQVYDRTQAGLTNAAPASATHSPRQIVIKHCLTFFNLVFLVLALFLLISGSSVKNMTFLIVVLCNTCIGIFQELKAKRAVDKLTLVAAQQLRTIRDGNTLTVRSDLLVRDDVVEFLPGNQICADAVLLTGTLQVNEALISGEEEPIIKNPGDPLHSGSFVVSGKGRARLTAVGAEAFAAKLAREAKAHPQVTKSEMMRSLDKLIQVVGIALIPVGLLLFYQEFQVLHLSLRESAEGTVSALVGMIPEGLYLLTSVAMAVSALKLARKKVLVQDMNCIETLARVDVLCLDKTGTITEAGMEVDNVVPLTADPPEFLEQVLAAFYAGMEPENDTARAMCEMFAGQTDWDCLRRIPFNSQSRWSSATFREQGSFLVGAPDAILGSRYEELQEEVESWSGTGYRVLLIAEYAGQPQLGGLAPGRVKPLALVLITNRIRAEAKDTFHYFASQGVAIKVISGDNPVTVAEVARRAGIKNADRYIDASHLETDQDYLQAVDTYTVFGRVSPNQKKKLVQALKRRGHTVAMTGDGVNDVLAMKEADCGIAMASGAQAASQVAQVVLLKSDFSVMPRIVGEGRRVINNIQRAATLFLVKNIFSIILAILSLFTQWAYPIVPLHLSVISALAIGAPSFFLAMEPNYERIRGRFLPTVFRKALPGGLTNVFVVLMAQSFMSVFDLPLAQVSLVCAGILAVVGLLVLYQTCKPLDKFRWAIWCAMALGLLICFTLLAGFFELTPRENRTDLIMTTLLIMTPTVFFAVQRLFDWGDNLVAVIKSSRRQRGKGESRK